MTDAQRRALANIEAGRPSSAGLSGMSEFGGHTRTLWSLRRKGWIDDDHNLTDDGRKALAEARAKDKR